MSDVALREVEDADLDAIFDQMRDQESVRMAAFVGRDPEDRAAFDAHIARLRAAKDIIFLAVVCDGGLAGTVGCFPLAGETHVTYWIARPSWGRGIAGRALALLLERVTVRPIHASAASDNAASLRVLQRAGFVVTGSARGYARARGEEIDETLLRLD